jgi:carboxyl-terminal processing protease
MHNIQDLASTSRMIKSRARALLLAMLVGSSSTLAQQSSDPVAPLFDVKLAHELDSAKSAFDSVRALILERYYTKSITEDALYWGAIQGMLRYTSPPTSPEQARIWTATEYQKVLNGLTGQRKSLGIKSHYDAKDASLTVTAVIAGSPADGVLEVHDRIMRIGKRALSGLSGAEIEQLLLSGGEPIQLTVVRDIQVFELNVQAKIHEVRSLDLGLLPNKVAYAGIRRVTAGVSGDLAQQLQLWRAQGVSRLILDLRNNGGGVFIEGLRLAELFVPKPGVLLQVVREGEPAKRYVSSNAEPFAAQIVVLINDATASAAEAMAAALATNGKAQLLGTKTYGKATMDRTFKLDNQMRVRFIVGAMYTPTGQSWHARGLAPNVDAAGKSTQAARWLDFPLDKRVSVDPQLKRAWQLLQQHDARTAP